MRIDLTTKFPTLVFEKSDNFKLLTGKITRSKLLKALVTIPDYRQQHLVDDKSAWNGLPTNDGTIMYSCAQWVADSFEWLLDLDGTEYLDLRIVGYTERYVCTVLINYPEAVKLLDDTLGLNWTRQYVDFMEE